MSIFTVPAASIWMAYEIFKNETASHTTEHVQKLKNTHTTQTLFAALLAGILTTLMLCTFGSQSSPGFTVEAAINKGFVPQSFALVPILICLGFVSGIKYRKSARYSAGIFFAISLLANVHAALLLVIVISCIYLSDILIAKSNKDRLNYLWLYLRIFGAAGFICSFWFVPLVTSYSYFSTVPLAFDWKYVLISMRVITAISFPVAGYFAYKNKNSTILGIVCGMSIILLLAATKADQHFSYLPLHIYRWLALLPYTSVLAVAYIFNSLKVGVRTNTTVFILIIAIVTGSYWTELSATSDNGIFFTYDSTDIDGLVSFLASRPGLTAVGTENEYWRSGSFVIDSKLGLAGVPTITHIIRESAPSGMFLTPIRNTFSTRAEMAGIRSYIGRKDEWLNQPMPVKIARAKAAGVRYLVVSDPAYNSVLATSTEVTAIAQFGPRIVYEIKGYQSKISVLPTLPTLLMTPLNFKARPENEYNYTSFNEQLLDQNAYPSVIFARETEINIDNISDAELAQFSSLVMTSYTYDNIDTALNKLLHFAEKKQLIVIQTPDKLFDRLALASLKNKNIHTFGNPAISKNQADRNKSIKKSLATMFGIIKNNPISSTSASTTPYYIRQTYFPWWQRIDGAKLYAASPMYTLTFKDPTNQLYFETPNSVRIGYTISILVLLLIAITEIVEKNKKVE